MSADMSYRPNYNNQLTIILLLLASHT
uniref:Uncharacterized protein n=1 Tax=Rhizophora mucronata TaxID=61149 RepID=A0A2P2QXY5_RHIMU